MTNLVRFIRAELNKSRESSRRIGEATGLNARSIDYLRRGRTDNAWTQTVERLARHLGYSIQFVRKDSAKAVKRRGPAE